MGTYSTAHLLVFAREIDTCPGYAYPVENVLRNRPDVVIWTERDNESNKSQSCTKALYRLNLKTPDIGNKFIEVYKEIQKICEQCRKNQQHKR